MENIVINVLKRIKMNKPKKKTRVWELIVKTIMGFLLLFIGILGGILLIEGTEGLLVGIIYGLLAMIFWFGLVNDK